MGPLESEPSSSYTRTTCLITFMAGSQLHFPASKNAKLAGSNEQTVYQIEHNVALLSEPILSIPYTVSLLHDPACILPCKSTKHVFIKSLYNTTTKVGRYISIF